ncbi:unnamed protein product [Lymnaea stagnalis]|uniref:Uncharacterized protein n=1 Tax=Lymnaea stagnalis TaxID=6523 RepID=A0AAV2IRK8_LYMST
MTKKKLPSLSLRTVNDKQVTLSDVPEEDVSSIRTTRSLQKESRRPPDVRQERMKQRSAGRRKVLKDMKLSSACDTLATKEDVVEHSTKRNSLLGKVVFGDHLKRAPVSSKRVASPRQSSDLENRDVTCSVLPSEASATLCNTLEDVDAIASSISIATPTRNSLCLPGDGMSLAAPDAGEALEHTDRDGRKDNAFQDVDACGDITNICDILDRLVKPDTRTQMSTLSELTVYTVGDDPELQIKLSEDNLESLAVLDLPITEETSDRARNPRDADGELAGDVEQTDVLEDLSEQALRTPDLQVEEEEDLSEQVLRTPDLQAEEEEDLSEQKLKTQARPADETEDSSRNTLRTQGGEEKEWALRTPGLEDHDQVESAKAPDSRSSESSVKKVKGDGAVEGKDGIETSEATFTTITNATETKAGGDKPQKRVSRKVSGGSPGGPPGGPPDDGDKKKPTEKLKRKKIDRNALFPPRVMAESHYYKHNNTINVVVKPVNAQLPTDGLNVKVHVHRRQSRLPVIPSQGAVEARKRSQPSPSYTLKKRASNTLPLITLDRDIIDLRAANPPFNTATNPEADTRYKKITRNWRVR